MTIKRRGDMGDDQAHYYRFGGSLVFAASLLFGVLIESQTVLNLDNFIPRLNSVLFFALSFNLGLDWTS